MIDKQESPEPQNVTRRRFIKRSGGATVGTAIGLYALQTPTWATVQDASTLHNCKKTCDGNPRFVSLNVSPDPNDPMGLIYYRTKQCYCTDGHKMTLHRHDVTTDPVEGLSYIGEPNPPSPHPNPHTTECPH